MKSSAKKIELASVDDLFSTEEGRQDAKLEKIQEIPLSELHPFRNHPFKVKDDEAMMETADSIKQYGVLVPAIARPDPEGGYELVSLPFGCETGIMESGTGTVILGGGITMRALVFLLKLLLKIVMVPVILALTLFVWICVGIVYVSGLVLGLISMVIALLGVAVLLTCSLQNGIILLVMAFLISPYGLPMAAIWLLGKVQDLKFAIQDLVYG